MCNTHQIIPPSRLWAVVGVDLKCRELVSSSPEEVSSVVGGGEVGESSLGGGGGIEERFINQDGSDMCREVAAVMCGVVSL